MDENEQRERKDKPWKRGRKSRHEREVERTLEDEYQYW